MKVRGIIHAHSTYSYDGKLSLVELKNLLFQHGLSFCCVTEHTDELTLEAAQAFVEECHQLSDQAFVFIPGFEVPYLDTHVLHIGTGVFLGQFADRDMLLRWREVTPWVVLAHPVRNKFIVDETLAGVIDGVEIWNQQYEGKWAPRFRSLQLYKELKQTKPELKATGGLDIHRQEHFGAPQVTLEVDELTSERIVRQLSLGFYTTNGNGIVINSNGSFKKGGGVGTRLLSFMAISIITIGKLLSRLLVRFGWRTPRWIRARV